MGVVYKARQVGLNRLIALKLIRTGAHASTPERMRFQGEAAALARMQHPGIVQVHEVGEVQGLLFFVMDFLPGGTLARRLRGQPMPPREAGHLVSSLARGVQYAHDLGVIHRDLKPANIIFDADGQARIADFGLARRLDSAQGPTCTGAVLGTPSYMAPEQAFGQTREIGPAADVYALGAILYECLTGRPPFRASNPTETLLQVVSDEPVAPSRLQAGLPRALEIICLKCLAKAPARRYPSAAALADDLDRYLSGEPIQARPASAPTRAFLWARRRPAPAALLALVGLLGVAILGGLLWFARHQHFRRLEAQSLGAEADTALADATRAQDDAQRVARQEVEARDQAETQRLAAQAALRQAQRESAELFLERGRAMCERGDIRLGVMWMARGLIPAAGEPDFQRIARFNVAGWLERFTPSLRVCLDLDEFPPAVVWSGQVVGMLGTPFGSGPFQALGPAVLKTRVMPRATVNAAAFSPDGGRVAIAYHKGVLIHDTTSGRKLFSIQVPLETRSVAWGRDGKWIAFGCGNGSQPDWHKAGPGAAHVIDSRTGALVGKPMPHPHAVRGVALSPDNSLVLTGCQDGRARLWDARTGTPRKQLELRAPVVGVGFSADGKHALTVVGRTGPDHKRFGEVQLWDSGTGQGGRSFPIPHDPAAAEFINDGRAVAISLGGHLGIWNTDPTSADFGKPVGKSVVAGKWSVAGSPDGALIATCGNDWQARVFETATGRQFGQSLLQGGWAYCVAFSPDGKTLLAGCGGTVALWALTPPRPPVAELRINRIRSLAFSPDRSRIVVAPDNNQVQLFDARTGRPLGIPLRLPGGMGLAIGPDNRTVVTGCFDGWVRIQDGVTGKRLRPGSWGHPAAVDVVAVSADGRLVVTGCRDGKARLLDLKTGKPVGVTFSAAGEITAAAFSPDGKVVVLGDSSFLVRGYTRTDGRPLGEAVRLTGQPIALAVSRDGRRVAVGTTGDNVARLVDVVAGRPIGPLLLHGSAVISVAFSPDEKILATGCSWGDNTARLWDTATGKALGPPIRHGGPVPAVAFSGDGAALWTTGTDRRVFRAALPVRATGSARRVYFETALRTGLFLDRNGVEHVVNHVNWQQLQELRAAADSKKD
jgi:WD40 repeat protein